MFMKLIEFKCQRCNSVLEVEDGVATIKCKYCGAKYALDDEVVHHKLDDAEEIGYKLEKGKQRAKQEQQNLKSTNNLQTLKRNVYITIFGGWFGLHKFMEGKIAAGILYLITFGIFFFGWLIDIFKIAVAYRDAVEASGGDKAEASSELFKTIGKILLWIFFLPIMFCIWVWERDDAPRAAKITITILVFILFCLFMAQQ